MQKFWCGVVSWDNGKRGEAGGYCQIGSGKKAPLARMAVGDGIVIYSPVTEFAGKEKCQSFTAIGTVVGAAPYAVEIAPDFMPFRRGVRYRTCQIAAIRPLIDQLVMTAGFPNWGFKFRLGHFEIGAADFALIAHAMAAGADPVAPDAAPAHPAPPIATAPSRASASVPGTAPASASGTASTSAPGAASAPGEASAPGTASAPATPPAFAPTPVPGTVSAPATLTAPATAPASPGMPESAAAPTPRRPRKTAPA